MIQLGEICTKASSNIAQKDLENCDGIYPIYGASGLIKCVDFYQQKKPYIAVVKDGAGVGRVMQLPAKSSVIGTMQYIIPNEEINVSYLAYAMEHMNLAKYYTGATIPHIYFKDYCKEKLKAHEICEQRKIATVLDKISNLISLRKQQLAKLDELVKARFVEMFGDLTENPLHWKREPLGNHIDILTGFPFDSTGYVSSGIKICGGLIIMPDKISWEDCKWWPNADGYEKYLLADADIVMALDRPWISDGFKIALISKDDLPSLLIQRTARIRAKDMDQLFIYSLLQDKAFSVHCSVTGSLVPHISHKDIKSYPVILPPLTLQESFAVFSKKVRRQKLTIQQSLDKLEVLKKSLMQNYFG